MPSHKMDVCVVGAGAIGGWVAARIAGAGHRVMALTSRGPVDGLEIAEGNETQSIAFERFATPARVLIVSVKAPALPVAAGSLGSLVGPETIILPMLNGVPWWFVDGEPLCSIDPAGTIAAALPLSQVLGCVVQASCYRPSAKSVVVKHADRLIVGEPDGVTGWRTEAVRALFEDAGIRCDVSDNVRRAIWYNCGATRRSIRFRR